MQPRPRDASGPTMISRTQRVLGGLSIGYVSLLLNLVVGLWLTPFLIRSLGPHVFGLWLVCLQILGYLALLDIGVLALVPRATAAALGSAESDRLVSVIGELRAITRWQAPAIGLVAIILIICLPERWRELLVPLAGTLLAYTVLFPLRSYHGVLQGLQDLSFVGRWQLTTWAIGTIALIAAVVAGTGLGAPVIGWVVQQTVFLVGCRWRVRRLVPDLVAHVGGHPTSSAVRTHLGQGLWVSLSQVSQILTSGTDMLLIARFASPAAAVTYSCTGKLTGVLVNLPQLVLHLAQPAMSEVAAVRDPERFLAVFGAVVQVVLVLSGGIALLVWAGNEAFVSWWVGPSQFGGAWLTLALAVALILRHVAVSMNYVAFCVGAERRLGVTVAIEGATAVFLGIALVLWIGLPGAALGTAVAAAVVNIPMNARTIARALGVPVGRVWIPYGSWARQLAIGVAVLIACRVAFPAWTEYVAVRVALVGTTYAAVMLPLALRAPLLPYMPALAAFLKDCIPSRATAGITAIGGPVARP